MKKGLFIAFEGGEGSGKSTQCKLLKEYLENAGQKVILTREPGGTPTGEKIREILKDAKLEKTPLAEVLLFNASRDCHIKQKIIPAKNEGAIVITDRFSDSTEAYQVGGWGVPLAMVRNINRLAVEKCMPDLVIIIIRDVETGLKDAIRTSGKDDHFEKQPSDFHKRVNAYYKKLAMDKTFNRVLIDGNRSIEEVFENVKKIVDELIQKEAR